MEFIGGISFFTPRLGLVCSNIVSYELVLASGSVINASESIKPDLWRALKGGANNFGIVTRFTARAFPCGNVWSGFLYMPAFQANKALRAFQDVVDKMSTKDTGSKFDSFAAGPLLCYTYIQQIGLQAVSINLVHTNPPRDSNAWPSCWHNSHFRRLWRVWSTCRVRTLTSATDEMNALNPPGRRQIWAHTTIENDLATLTATHAIYEEAISWLRAAKVKGIVWTLVLQPLLPEWVRIGDENPLGFDAGSTAPLVNVEFTVNWEKNVHDDVINSITRQAIEKIDAYAVNNNTSHPYRYLNYCADWQKPFDGYGEANLKFLQAVSKKYDPEGLFQKACTGGFKLGINENKD